MLPILIASFTFSFLCVFVSAHGFLSNPPPRGIDKRFMQVDDLKAPNTKGLCRGEPAGAPTSFPSGSTITLKFEISAPHIGMCFAYLMNTDGSDQVELGRKMDCVAPGKVVPWVVSLPAGVAGKKTLRWVWDASHSIPHEGYEQCADLELHGGGGNGQSPVRVEAPHSGATPVDANQAYPNKSNGDEEAKVTYGKPELASGMPESASKALESTSTPPEPMSSAPKPTFGIPEPAPKAPGLATKVIKVASGKPEVTYGVDKGATNEKSDKEDKHLNSPKVDKREQASLDPQEEKNVSTSSNKPKCITYNGHLLCENV